MKAYSILIPVLALTACGSGPDTQAPPQVQGSELGSSGQSAPSPDAPAEVAPSSTAVAIDLDVPDALQGRWGLVPADCTSTRGDAKGLLVVEPRILRFYESRGTPKDITEYNESRIRAVFDFSGEGMTWQRDMTLAVEDAGDTLVREEHGEDAAPEPLRYARCR